MSIDVEELDDKHEQRNDFRRANGAPLVKDAEGKTQRYSRPSGYAKPLDDEHALWNWRLFKAMDGVARSKALQAQIIAFSQDYQLVMIFILCSIPLAIMIGSTKATLRKQAAGPEHAVME